jgi:hypothetical protein
VAAAAAAAAAARARATQTGGHGSSGVSTAAIVLAALGAALALGALAWALVRLSGVEPRWTVELRASLAEAGYRASATWAELGDWMRLGR